jgi:hypothetical protein
MTSRVGARDRLLVLATLAASPAVDEESVARLAVAWPALLRNVAAGRIRGIVCALRGLDVTPVAALDSAKRLGLINEGNAAALLAAALNSGVGWARISAVTEGSVLSADKFGAEIVGWFLHSFRFTPPEAAAFVSTSSSGPFEGKINILAPDALFAMAWSLPLAREQLFDLLLRMEECASRVGPLVSPSALTQKGRLQITPRTFPLLFFRNAWALPRKPPAYSTVMGARDVAEAEHVQELEGALLSLCVARHGRGAIGEIAGDPRMRRQYFTALFDYYTNLVWGRGEPRPLFRGRLRAAEEQRRERF